MINYKSVKWGFGVVLSLGLSACNMLDTQRSEHVDKHMENTQQKVVSSQHKPVQKTYASKDPSQKATPGPVRKVAPQLPVIQ